MPVNNEQLNEILRLRLLEGWSVRRIARHLHLCRRTVDKRLAGKVAPTTVRRQRASKLDPFKPLIGELLEADPQASRRRHTR